MFFFQFNVQIKKTIEFVKIHKVENTFYNSFEYIKINFYILKKLLNENKVIVHFKREIYIVNNFRVNILFKTNIFELKKVVIDIKQKFISFLFYKNILIFINIIVKKRRIFRILKSVAQFIIFVYFCIFVFVKIKKNNLLIDRNYFFYFKQNFKNFDLKFFFLIILRMRIL